MGRRTIDVVAAGPPSSDLYDPAAPAWALAAGLAARGHAVQVAFPGPEGTPAPSATVTVAPFSPVTAHVGSFLGDAELAREAAHRLRPTAEAIVRDPAGLGALGFRHGRRPVISFLRAFADDPTTPARPGAAGVRSKLLGWGERRSVRRLQREALEEASAIFCATSAQRDRLRADYGIPPERVRLGSPAVAHGPTPPSREAARRRLAVPDDVLLAVLLPPVDPAAAPEAAPAVEAFRRTRPIFTGARLGVVGVAAGNAPGVVAVPSRDAEAVGTAAAAADVAVAYAPGTVVDPGVVLALRAGVATIVAPSLDLGEGAEAAVRRAPTADSGELASVLAELFADPEARRTLGERARAFARRFEPEHLAEELEAASGLGPN